MDKIIRLTKQIQQHLPVRMLDSDLVPGMNAYISLTGRSTSALIEVGTICVSVRHPWHTGVFLHAC